MKILIIFNTCGILPGDRTSQYINNINSVLDQTVNLRLDCKVVISDCLSSQDIRQKLISHFGNQLSYNWINTKIPILPSFNHTVLTCVEYFGKFDGYMYMESGVELDDPTIISQLCSYLNTNKYALISTVVDTDLGFHYDENPPDLSSDYIIPVGQSLNGHCKIYSEEYFKFYNRIFPDIFAGHCMESVESFCCAAIQKQWIIVANAKVKHDIDVDGQSAGFKPIEYVQRTGKPTWDHPYLIDSLQPIFFNEEAKRLGLGYEEARKIVMHDPSQFDENQHCINNQLKEYIKKNLFLPEKVLNYAQIPHVFIPQDIVIDHKQFSKAMFVQKTKKG